MAKEGGDDSAVTVQVRGGLYELPAGLKFEARDSGTADAPVVWKAFENEKPVLIGGRAITGWKPWKDGILQTDVKAQGFGGIVFKQLFFGGKRMGGIGIMNIMLVSVTERTREIGVRMAVGATPLNILLQFLVEALTLAVAGGMIGVALARSAGRLAAKFGWPTLVRPDIVVISVCFSGLVGVVFGLYPARKASQLDPIDALRYE